MEKKIRKIVAGLVLALAIVLLPAGGKGTGLPGTSMQVLAASKTAVAKSKLTTYYRKLFKYSKLKGYFADVTRDGVPELIITFDKGSAYAPYHYVMVYTYYKGTVKRIWAKKGTDSHGTGWIDVHLYKTGGKYYLVNKTTEMWQGYGKVGYSVFYLTQTGKVKYLRKDMINGKGESNLYYKLDALGRRYRKYCTKTLVQTSGYTF